jgi:hypothetical protein
MCDTSLVRLSIRISLRMRPNGLKKENSRSQISPSVKPASGTTRIELFS